MEAPIQYARVKSLFLQARELTGDELRSFLEQACGGDTEVRDQVDRLLQQDTRAGGDLLTRPQETTRVATGEALQRGAVNNLGQVGSYRLVRRLGEGGMGTVFEAEQPNPRRLVALKMMSAGRFASEYSIKLFEREIQALARLKHPRIASIHEAGCTEDGHHFFTMELAGGETLGAYLARRKQTTRQLIELFLKICDAVTYAHQHGVIHRDLKPSNIMVQEEQGVAEVKVLDFGLARIHDDSSGEVLTQTGSVQGTLPYMSPEQVTGNRDEIDLRTDVYALGVILYEALAGRLPLELRGLSFPEAARVIQEDQPPPLQRAATGAQRLDEDLCTIVHKALERSASQRYASASALAEDLTRYLENQPIQARPPSTVYQLRKLVARHRLGVGFAFTVIALIVAFAIAVTVQAQHIARERDRANQEAETAKQVSSFLSRSFGIANPNRSRGNTITAREILDQGAARIQGELKTQPAVRASLLLVMAGAYTGLGLYPEARKLSEESLELRRTLFGPKSLEVSAALHELAMIVHNQGDWDQSIRFDRESLVIRGALLPNVSLPISETLTNLGATLGAKGDYQQAVPVLREALDVARKLEGSDGLRTVNAIQQLGAALLKARDYDSAEPLLREAIGIYERRNGKDDSNVAFTLNDLGNLLGLKDDYAGAEMAYRRCRDIAAKIYGPQHPNVAILDENLAVNLRRQRRLPEAEALMRDSMARFVKALGDQHPRYSVFLEGLADILSDKGDLAGAGKLYRQGLEFDLSNPKASKPHLAVSYARLGSFLARNGRPNDGEPLLRKGLELYEKTTPAGSPEMAEYQRNLGRCLTDLKRFAEAEPVLLRSYQMFSKTFGSRHRQTQESGAALAALYSAWGRPDDAARYRTAGSAAR